MGTIRTETSHAMSVTPFRKVSLECFWTTISLIATYLTLVINVQAMQFVQPIRNRLSIPSQRKIFRIVNNIIMVFFVSWNKIECLYKFINWSNEISKQTNFGSENSKMTMKSHYDVIGQCYVIIVFLTLSAYTFKTMPKESAVKDRPVIEPLKWGGFLSKAWIW